MVLSTKYMAVKLTKGVRVEFAEPRLGGTRLILPGVMQIKNRTLARRASKRLRHQQATARESTGFATRHYWCVLALILIASTMN